MLIGYARVSTSDQSLEPQLDALREAGCAKIYTEKASGSRQSQKQLAIALEHLRPGETLVVSKIDRLGRDMLGLLETVEQINKLGGEFRSLSEAVDTATPMGKAFFHMACIFADLEREKIRERTKQGLDAAKKRGRVGGRPKALTNEQSAQARRMREEGESPSKIARVLGVSVSTVRRL